MKKNFLALGTCTFALALGLVACGDDGGSNSVTNGEKGEVIALADGSGEKVCDDKLEGWVAEAVGKDFRRCLDGEWTKITANEASAEDEIIGGVTVLLSSSSSVIPSSSSVTPGTSSSVIPSEVEGSSSSVTSSSSAKSSSSVVSSSSEKSSSSVASSSSVKSSSSVASSSSAKSSSSVVSSSSEKSSSSVASSSSVKSSSSVVSSSSVKSSSSVASSSSAKSSSSVVSSSSVKSSSSVASSSSAKSSSSVVSSSSSIKYGSFTDSRDNQVYKTVTIGTQTWMAENLNYAYTGVKYNFSSYTSGSTSWCYENKASNCDKYGRLYTWSAVMDSAAQFNVNAGTKCGYGKTCTPNSPHRGICPEGWHVPTNVEYSTLYTYIGGSSTAGSLLKSTSGWNDYNGKSGNGTDKYGFSVLPAGYRDVNGNFRKEGYYANLWSASENGSLFAWYQYFYYDGDNANQDYGSKYYGRSLRCLKD